MARPADAATRRRLALMHKVTGAQQAGSAPHRRARHLPETDKRIRTALDKGTGLETLRDLCIRLGCPNEHRRRVWPLLCGVVAIKTPDFTRDIVQADYDDLLRVAEALDVPGAALLRVPWEDHAVPFMQRSSLLSNSDRDDAAATGRCYYCGEGNHFLRECPKYFDNNKGRQEALLTAVYTYQYLHEYVCLQTPVYSLTTQDPVLHRDGPLWLIDDSRVHLWLRALVFRLLEAVPVPSLVWGMAIRIARDGWEGRVEHTARKTAEALCEEAGDASTRERVTEILTVVLTPMLGSLLALGPTCTELRLFPNDMVLRTWDAILCLPDPLHAASVLVLLLLRPVSAQIISAPSIDDACQLIYSTCSAMETWADEQQRQLLLKVSAAP